MAEKQYVSAITMGQIDWLNSRGKTTYKALAMSTCIPTGIKIQLIKREKKSVLFCFDKVYITYRKMHIVQIA